MPDKMILIFKVKPKDLSAIDRALEALKAIKFGKLTDTKKEPIGFGIEVIKASVVVDAKDEEAIERVTREILAMPEIEDAEVEGMTLI